MKDRKKFVPAVVLLLTVTILFCGCSQKASSSGETYIKKGITEFHIVNGSTANIKNGDIISITAPKAPDTIKELQYVEVTSVNTATDNDVYDEISEGYYDKSITNPIKVSFAFCEQQRTAYAALNLNAVKISLVCRGGSEKAQELLQKQDEIIDTFPAPKDSQTAQVASTSSENVVVYSSSQEQTKQASTVTESDVERYDEQLKLLNQ
jgi:hypothetical protein